MKKKTFIERIETKTKELEEKRKKTKEIKETMQKKWGYLEIARFRARGYAIAFCMTTAGGMIGIDFWKYLLMGIGIIYFMIYTIISGKIENKIKRRELGIE